MPPNRGTLFLVVGPSGAGKDSVMTAARAALPPGSLHVFARRVITRPADAGGEAHETVTPGEFARLREAGALALWWEAHGLCYGLRREIADALVASRPVIANVSRSAIAEASARFAPVRVVEITAPAAVLAARLAGRGREDEADVRRRLLRTAAPLAGDGVTTIVNDGALGDAVAAFLTAIR